MKKSTRTRRQHFETIPKVASTIARSVRRTMRINAPATRHPIAGSLSIVRYTGEIQSRLKTLVEIALKGRQAMTAMTNTTAQEIEMAVLESTTVCGSRSRGRTHGNPETELT
eukprot:7864291-Pyramimonas_sp.AAC.1